MNCVANTAQKTANRVIASLILQLRAEESQVFLTFPEKCFPVSRHVEMVFDKLGVSSSIGRLEMDGQLVVRKSATGWFLNHRGGGSEKVKDWCSRLYTIAKLSVTVSR